MASPEVLPQVPAPEQAPQAEAPVEAPIAVEQPSQVQPAQPPQQPQEQSAPSSVQSVPQDDTNTLVVPLKNNEELEALSHGDAADANTWRGVFWIYKIKKALHAGLRAVFGGN